MKFLFLLCAFLVGAQCLTEEQKTLLRDHYKVCIEQTGASRDLIGRTRKGDFDFQDDKVEDFFFCLYQRSGLMTAEGDFKRDVAVSKVAEDQREDVGKAIDECLALKTDTTSAKNAFAYAKCYMGKRPDDFKFD